MISGKDHDLQDLVGKESALVKNIAEVYFPCSILIL